MLSGYYLSQLCMRKIGLTDPPEVSGQVSLIVLNQFQSCQFIHTAQHMNWKVSAKQFLVQHSLKTCSYGYRNNQSMSSLVLYNIL